MAHFKSKYFPFLLMFSAFVVEACAAFFSVYGLTKLFSGSSFAVGLMAGSLEFAKVISASYLYRYWKDLGKLYKTYLTTAVMILMLITSIGIYGFLSNAFQGSTLNLEKEVAKLNLQEDEINRIKQDNETLKIEKQELQKNRSDELAGLVILEETRYQDVNRRTTVSRRYETLIKEKDTQITENNKKIESLSQAITDSKINMIDTGADVGPIIFVSKAFNIDIATTVQYLILLFIIVFDPLALALIIAFNKITISNWQIDHDEPKNEPRQDYTVQTEPKHEVIIKNEPPNEVIEQPIKIEPTVQQEIPKEIVDKTSEVVYNAPPQPKIEQPQPPIIEEESKVYVDTEKEDKYRFWPKPTQTSSF